MRRCFFFLLSLVLLLPAAAEPLDVDALLGENWYGLYLNGQKAGYSFQGVKRDEDTVMVVEDARFQINMAGIRQDMLIYVERRYALDGSLKAIDSRVEDPSGTTTFVGEVRDNSLILTSTVGGAKKESVLPVPKESLQDAVKHTAWIRSNPAVGDELTFSIFEPMYAKEIGGVSILAGEEERVFEGVPTKVYKVKTEMEDLGIDSVSYVTEEGLTLEDVVAGIIVMRLESEEQARDVQYNNDVIVSNAAILDQPIQDPYTRESIRLIIEGPLAEQHMFNDARQKIEGARGRFDFSATRMNLEGVSIPALPIDDASVAEWLKPTTYIQSDHPKIIARAKEILGETTDAFEATEKLCHWVNEEMQSTFSARLTNALEVFESMEGDCTEHSVLFIALARAAGLPAREVAGLIYVHGAQPGFYFHQWAKVWVGQWIDVDPTFNQPLADVTHIKLAEGDLMQQARIIPIIGQLSITVVDE